MLTKPDVWN